MIVRPDSLQGRLVLMVLAGVTVIWLGAAALTWFDARHELDELLDGHLAQAAAMLVAQQAGEPAGDNGGVDTPALHRYAPRVAFQVFHQNRLALRSFNAPASPMIEPGPQFRSGFATIAIHGQAWRVFAAYGAERDVQVYVAEQASSRDAILRAVLRSTLWPLALALPLLALIIWWAVRSGVAPLRQLGRALTERQPQALHPVSLNHGDAEIRPLIAALNGLFARIGALLESERRFTADAAHELRTPIAAIRIQAQVAMGESDDALRRHALQGTLDGCDRAARLIDQLLTLARMEAIEAPQMARLDLVELVRRVLAALAPTAIGKQQTLELVAPSPCSILGNETLLTVLVRNLVDNAVRYSAPGAPIRVSVRGEAGAIELWVEDGGPGLGEVALGRLGERFFRVGGGAESGSGLGWSIVRRIAAVHGLALATARSVQLGGLAVRVSFPTAAAQAPC
jgi:two-component system sensor histidine kinase QseC